MAKKMLLDASHPEETRVAILSGSRLEDFDFESISKKQFKGNIYLAKVIRIEPSLQAAFVEYGGNRHGFLPFSEIHPDYYRIPIEDRENLLKEQAEAFKKMRDGDNPVEKDEEIDVPDEPEEMLAEEKGSAAQDNIDVVDFSPDETLFPSGDTFTGEKEPDQEAKPFVPLYRRYKIQEVIKRRQIMLIQVSKEERGGKGAALTTYLSIAGRYCVLMPNSPNSGGISRKITNLSDRKRLRSIVDEIELPESMSLIVRTAGMSRTKPEIKRDCDYLVRLWNDIREATLKSSAPSLVYEEGDLIKRSLRDYYSKDIDEVWVEGAIGFEEAKVFIKQLMPSHVRRIKEYTDPKVPLFFKYGVEDQISAIHDPSIQLKSGGYIVFGMTEALVAIDVNSGRATRERHIDETAFKTNLEAADEIARQLRLRDLAGLVVIDFIDMEDPKYIEAVERRLRDAMRDDRARVQIGRISNFGLMELSRQRLRPNIMEATSVMCTHCQGAGMVRSVSSSALHILRAIEDEMSKYRDADVIVYLPTEVGFYILNEKRATLQDIESRCGAKIKVAQDESLTPGGFRIENLGAQEDLPQKGSQVSEKVESSGAKSPSSKKFQQRGARRGPYGKGRQDKKRESKQDKVAERLLAEARSSSQGEGESVPPKESSAETQDRQQPRKRGGRRGQGHRRKGRGDHSQHPRAAATQDASEKSSGNKPPVNDSKKPKDSSASQGSKGEKGPAPEKKKGTRKSWIQRLLD